MGQASVAQIEIAALASVAVVMSESMASTSAASALAKTPTKTKTPVKHKAADRYAIIYTDSEDEANRETQSVSPSLLRRPHSLISHLRKHPNRKRKKNKSKSKKSDTSDTDSYRREVEERCTKAIEDMAKSFRDPVVKSPFMPTPSPATVIVEELDDDKLWAHQANKG